MSAGRLYRYARIHVDRYVHCTSMYITSINVRVDDSTILLRDVAIF